jgi:hypothetical protein
VTTNFSRKTVLHGVGKTDLAVYHRSNESGKNIDVLTTDISEILKNRRDGKNLHPDSRFC